MKFSLVLCLLSLGLGGMWDFASAQDGRASLSEAIRAGQEIWKSEPRLFEGNGSYYQLIYDAGEDVDTNSTGVRWEHAVAKSRKLSFQGRRGRLARLDSSELYAWVLSQWDLTGVSYGGRTWIGLRYWCSYRRLTWSTGEMHEFNQYGAWDTPWHRPEGGTCTTNQKLPYMGVYIEGGTGRWRATGFKKAYPYYLVEYPPDRDTMAETSER